MAAPGRGHLFTVGHEDGHDLVIFGEHGTPETLRADQWRLMEVLPRGRELYDLTKVSLEAPDRKKKGNLNCQLVLDAGWHMGPEEHKYKVPGGSGSFEGNEFKTEPEGSVTGRQAILYHIIVVRGNLIPIKLWVNGNGTFSTLFNGSSYALEQIRQELVETMKAIHCGGITPIIKYAPLDSQQFEIASQRLDTPINPQEPEDPRNPV
ncbi:hypothetical protein TrVFT333_009833 [Trichoderma virens FT-333]|nr:hypothetical protein TrVFT333_009833 [Trichoderma virens FT-333]